MKAVVLLAAALLAPAAARAQANEAPLPREFGVQAKRLGVLVRNLVNASKVGDRDKFAKVVDAHATYIASNGAEGPFTVESLSHEAQACDWSYDFEIGYKHDKAVLADDSISVAWKCPADDLAAATKTVLVLKGNRIISATAIRDAGVATTKTGNR